MYSSTYSIFYFVIFIISALFVLGMEVYYNRDIDKYFLSMAILVPVISFGYLMRTQATSVEVAVWGNRLVYFEYSYFMALVYLCMLHALDIPIRRLRVGIIYIVASIVYLLNWLGTQNGIFYKSVDIAPIENAGTRFITVPGKLHWVVSAYLALIFLAMLSTVVMGFFRRKQYSYKVVMFFAITVLAAIALFVCEKVMNISFSLTPAALFAAVFVTGHLIDWINSRNMNQVANFVLKERDIERGLIAFDKKKRFLGANEDAYKMFPELRELDIESKIEKPGSNMLNVLAMWMDEYRPVQSRSVEGKYKVSWSGDKAYKYVVHSSYARQRYVQNGFYFEITDVTANQKYIEMVRTTNRDLKSEVASQTTQIAGMQNKVVFGLANMIENRDFSTGGHVKRTSDVVRILVDELKKEGDPRVNDIFISDIVRAAPMHDLGKIAVDNAILQKPAKLTKDEFEQMKVHSEKSGKIVHGILEGVEEEHFVDVSYNVARHHHERWDGKGYPDGLCGEEIPFEARIMAVADVYDALVSSRAYKEAMDYESAYCEIISNMGTQFDPSLRKAFDASVKSLEEYYSRSE